MQPSWTNFYPRPPRGGRRGSAGDHHPLRNFYPRPPRGGRRCGAACFHLPDMISIHALREEGDRVRVAGEFPRQEFLSTPSARRATAAEIFWQELAKISIHALREEGDLLPCIRPPLVVQISIHALREEGDSGGGWKGRHRDISIHALREEGDCPHPRCQAAADDFYPRPPRGGRHQHPQNGFMQRYFYPRPPRGGRPRLVCHWGQL